MVPWINMSQAATFIKKAESSLESGFFKKPDFSKAVECYSQAAECYKNNGEYKEAFTIYKKISKLHEEKLHSLFNAAKTEEEAANICRQMKNLDLMSETILLASNKYRVNGTPNAACQLLVKTSKLIDEERPDLAAKFLKQATEAASDKGDARDAGEYMGQAAKLYARANKFDEAINCLEQKIRYLGDAGVQHEASKALISLVLLKLVQGDVVGATKMYQQYIANGDGSGDPVENLLRAFNCNDYETIRRILNSPTFLYLENDYARLARNLANKQPEASVNNQSNPSESKPAGTVVDDDEDIN